MFFLQFQYSSKHLVYNWKFNLIFIPIKMFTYEIPLLCNTNTSTCFNNYRNTWKPNVLPLNEVPRNYNDNCPNSMLDRNKRYFVIIIFTQFSRTFEKPPTFFRQFTVNGHIAFLFNNIKTMCGRSACTLAPDQLKQSLQVNTWCNQEQYKPCYNVGPNGFEPVMYMRDSEQILRTMRWGKWK